LAVKLLQLSGREKQLTRLHEHLGFSK